MHCTESAALRLVVLFRSRVNEHSKYSNIWSRFESFGFCRFSANISVDCRYISLKSEICAGLFAACIKVNLDHILNFRFRHASSRTCFRLCIGRLRVIMFRTIPTACLCFSLFCSDLRHSDYHVMLSHRLIVCYKLLKIHCPLKSVGILKYAPLVDWNWSSVVFDRRTSGRSVYRQTTSDYLTTLSRYAVRMKRCRGGAHHGDVFFSGNRFSQNLGIFLSLFSD